MPTNKYTVNDNAFWKIVSSLFLASFFIFAALYAVHPLISEFVNDYGVSVSSSSLTLSLSVFGLIAGLILFGFLSDRVGRQRFIILSIAGAVVPFLLIPLFETFWLMLLLRFLQGFLLAGLPATALAYMSEELDPRSVGFATTFYISSNALGGMIGRFLTGFIADHSSWQVAFYMWAAVGLVIFIAVLFLLLKPRFFEPSQASLKKDIAGFLYHLKNPFLLLIFGLGVVLQFSFTGVWTYLPFHMQGAPFFLPLHVISYLYLAYGLGIIGSPLGGWFTKMLNAQYVRLIGIGIMILGLFLTLADSVTLIVIGLGLMCLGFFTSHALTAASVTALATHHKGSASSLYFVFYYIGVSMGSTALAPVWDAFGWSGLIVTAGLVPGLYIILFHSLRGFD